MDKQIIFKPKFIERYSQLTDWEEFKQCSLSFLRRSIRANTLKMSTKELKKRLEKNWNLRQIPWCEEGFWIEHIRSERRDIGNLIEHSLGYFYTQEAASMIPPIVLSPNPHDIVLDIAASPGSKTTQMAQYMQNKGILIANDYTIERMKPLSINLQRCGASNAIITLMNGQWFKKSGIEFDKVLGLKLKESERKQELKEIPEQLKSLLSEREKARNEKNFAKSDEIRKKIESLGYEIQDSQEGIKLLKK